MNDIDNSFVLAYFNRLWGKDDVGRYQCVQCGRRKINLRCRKETLEVDVPGTDISGYSVIEPRTSRSCKSGCSYRYI